MDGVLNAVVGLAPPARPVVDHSLRPSSPWVPYSPCTPEGCVEATDRVPMVVALVRVLTVLGLLVAAALLALCYPLLGAVARVRLVRGWFRAALRACGVRARFDGALAEGPVLMVSNHVSWVDILLLGAVRPGRMVARADLRDWAGLGPTAARAGTIFVDRDRLSTLPRTVADMAAALRAGATVQAFPEGTTWCGVDGGKRFYPALFQAAVDADVPVVPVAIRYRAGGRPSTAAAFVGEDALLTSVWRVVRTRGLSADVTIHPALPPTTRRDLATRAGGLTSTCRNPEK